MIVAPALYVGRVMHHRMKPKTHRFSYDVFSCLLDLDQLDAVHRASCIFSVDRFNLLAFHQRDHGDGKPDGLAAQVRARLDDSGVVGAGHQILLLAYPRVLGFVFNPLAVYYCFRDDGRLGALVYEVANTFGERHRYIAPIAPEDRDAIVRQECDKAFYVSPFLDMRMRYKFRLTTPDAELRLRILEEDDAGPVLAATFSARRRTFATRPLLGAFLRLPLMTVKVLVAIHWEALRLWAKGVRLVPKPPAPAAEITILHPQAPRGTS